MLKTIIIDDERDSLDLLEIELANHCSDVQLVAKCANAKEALIFLKKNSVDLIFLDINMPLISGLDLIEMLPSGDYEVVFITAFEHFAVKAFKTSAVDYLLKPIATNDLIEAVRAVKNRKNKTVNNKLEFLSDQMDAVRTNTVKKVMLPTIDGITFIYLNEIIYCESCENYSNIFLDKGEKLFVLKSLKFIEEILSDYNFLRIHKSYIINLDKIKTYNKTGGGHLIMENDAKINISRTKKELFTNYIENHI